LREGFVCFVCYIHATFMHHVYIPALAFCFLMRYLSYIWIILSLLYHVTSLVLAHKVVLPCLTLISYELCFCVLILHVSSYEYILLAWST
jgi:hypothetical protein